MLDWRMISLPVRPSTFGCKLCPDLVESRTWICDGNGPVGADAKLVVIGEAPGAEEDQYGVPFIGQSGQLLKDTLAKSGLMDGEVFYTNTVRCRPPENRDPTEREVQNCSGWLVTELQILKPRAVLLLGKIAAQSRHVMPDVPVFEMYHPAYILRTPRFRQEWEDGIAQVADFVLRGTVKRERGVPAWSENRPFTKSPWLALDTETDDLTEGVGVRMVSWSMSDGECAMFSQEPDPGRLAHVWLWNAKYDAPLLDINLRRVQTWDDAMLIAYVLRYPAVGLKPMAESLLGWKMTEIKQIIGTGKKRVSFSQALEQDEEKARKYACEDAVATSRLAKILSQRLDTEPVLKKYYHEIEKPIVPVLQEMEARGVRVNRAKLKKLGEELAALIKAREEKIRDYWGQDETWRHSRKRDLIPVLESAGADLKWETETGQVRLDEQVLLKLAEANTYEEIIPDSPLRELVQDILYCREQAKLASTYAGPLLAKLDTEDRVHARFNQAVASTNRLSSSEPNLQNIPIRGAIGTRIREMFEAKPGHVFVRADYSQLEVRIYAERTLEPVLVDAYTHETHDSAGKGGTCARCDVHQQVADTLGIARWRAKNVLFAAIYGADAPKLAETAGVPVGDTGNFLHVLRDRLPSLLSWQATIQREHDSRGYVETLLGWRNSYPLLGSPFLRERREALREAANFPIQGSASGIVKRAMILLDTEASSYDAGLVLQVHDEVVYEVPTENAHEWARRVSRIGSEAGEDIMRVVPLVFSPGIGPDWAHCDGS